MGCLKILHTVENRKFRPLGTDQKSALNESWKIFVGGVEKTLSSERKCLNYYPFGMLQLGRTYSSNSYRYGYQGSEKDDEVSGSGNNYTTFYRGLDSRLARWKSIDPKATAWESPFVSMGNNPILWNDVLGDTLRPDFIWDFKKDPIQQRKDFDSFRKEFYTSWAYLKDANASFVLDELQKLPQTIPVVQTDGSSHYDPVEKRIYWNPTEGILTTNFYEMSPAEVLSHEVDHALEHFTHPDRMWKNSEGPDGSDPDYSNKEEKRVITGSETKVAIKLKKIKSGEVTRKDHSYSAIILT